MKSMLWLLCLSSLALGQSYQRRSATMNAAAQTFDRGPRLAILIGVGDYPESSGLASLKYPKKDVEELAAELRKEGYLVTTIINDAAPRGLVIRALKHIGESVKEPPSTLLFYFSGHGFASAAGVNYLVPFGAAIDDLEREGLAVTEVEQLVKASHAKQQMIWIDACRDNPASSMKGASRRSFSQLQAAEGTKILLSTQPGAVTVEDDRLQHGVFTYFLLRGLRGEAAGSDGLVTFEDLTHYLTTSLVDFGKKNGIKQTPYEAGESSGDFLLVKATRAPAAPSGSFNPGIMKVNPKDELAYLFIPAGTFKMGCDTATCFGWELSQHDVKLSTGYWLGQTEVTQSAYERVMGLNPSLLKGANKPVENITWDEAQAYCSSIGGRLPTEAEWEYAARAGGKPQTYRLHWKYGDLTHDIGQNENANGWNLYDMMGNVWEWTADWYSENVPSGLAVDPNGPADGKERVTRGASFNTPEQFVRTAIRSKHNPAKKDFETGFRCVWQ